jgi:obg-like ATPase 1
MAAQATVEKVYRVLTVDEKDVRKADWTNKEVS